MELLIGRRHMVSKVELFDKLSDYPLTVDFLLIALFNYFSIDELKEFVNYVKSELNEG